MSHVEIGSTDRSEIGTGRQPIRVMFVDDHRCVSQGLAHLLAKLANIDVVAEAEDGGVAVALARRHHPDVVVMDAYLPKRKDSVAATKAIVADNSAVRVLVLSSASSSSDIRALLKVGATGYATKNCAVEEIAQAIVAVADGRRYFCQTAAASLADDPNGDAENSMLSKLTARERAVFRALAEGKDTGTISALFHISQDTVATHRRNIFRKLQLTSVPELIWYAIENRCIE